MAKTTSAAFEYAPAPESRSIVDIKPSYGLFVNGEFVDGHGAAFKTLSPATEEVLAEIAAINSELDALGITLDTDPRRSTRTGQEKQQEKPDAGETA